MFESLDGRHLFASISGTLWNDADGSGTFDTGERPLKNVTVFVDANANGRLDSGERTRVTNKFGEYEFPNVADGTTLLGVATPEGTGQTTPGRLGASQGDFHIDLVGTANLPLVQRTAFQAAATRLESIIIGDVSAAGGIDDLRIDVSVARIDGAGDTLAEAGPVDVRASGLPYTGELTLDSADIPDLIATGHLTDTITHEMLHILGFGTVWSDLGLIRGEGTRNPQFTGRAATREYNELFQTVGTGVPVESGGGDGTADGHWAESTFVEELMTGFDEGKGRAEPLSRITVASLADLGYSVNLDAADVWDPLKHTSTVTTPLDLGAPPFERRITASRDERITDLDFGFRPDTAPRIGRLSGTNAVLGKSFTVTAGGFSDAEKDSAVTVSFYGETNGVPGLQRGRGGDLYLGTSDGSTATGGTGGTGGTDAKLTVSTAGLFAGQQLIFAVASDALGLGSRATTSVTLTAPPPPTRPNPVVATRESRSTAMLQWRDRSTDEIGFRVQLLTDDGTVVQSFNVPAGSAAVDLVGLTRGTFYTARVRSYGYGGASAYTRAERFRV